MPTLTEEEKKFLEAMPPGEREQAEMHLANGGSLSNFRTSTPQSEPIATPTQTPAPSPTEQGAKIVPIYDTESGKEIAPSGLEENNTEDDTPVVKTPYSDYDEFVNKYFGNVLTDEEREKRERAAYINAGVASLGKAMGALGNMFVARHGAPAQTSPTTPNVDKQVDAFRQHADRVRQQYLNAKLAGNKLDLDRWKTEQTLGYQKDLLKYKNGLLDFYNRRENRMLNESESKIAANEANAKYKTTMAEIAEATKQGLISEREARVRKIDAETKRINAMADLYGVKAAVAQYGNRVDFDYYVDANGNLKVASKTTTPLIPGGATPQGGSKPKGASKQGTSGSASESSNSSVAQGGTGSWKDINRKRQN